MNYTVTHATTYRYSSPVNVCHNVLILEPKPSPALHCNSYRLAIHPKPKITGRRADMFGNFVYRFSLEESHSLLKITSTSRVTVEPRVLPTVDSSPTCAQVTKFIRNCTDPNWLEVTPFLFDSPRIRRSAEYAAWTADIVAFGKPVVEAARRLTERIHSDMKYDKDATRVDTPTDVAFAGRHGVCQDFAHVAVACLRSCGLPAKYVSGYLRTTPAPGTTRLVGADESHAWFSVYCGSELGWIDFDPTNNCVRGPDHVPIASGRDYSDVVPVRGIFLGGGDTTMTISVNVAVDG